MAKEKVILAYSGGLDTTAIIPWLKENYNYDVVCCCINCGQGEELDGLEERAKYSGAAKLYIEDITDEFCDDYIVPCVQADAVYENKYLLGTAMARPGIAKKLVEIARKEDAVAICHGATGKGNDQIRFELGIKALAPDIKIIAPWRDDKWNMDSREAEIEYCKAHGIDLPFGTDQSYSRDRNLWHISHEGLELENPANEPNYEHLLMLGVSPEKAPDEGEYVTMTFEKGVPTSVNGKKMKVSDIVRELNRLGGKHGIGIIDIVENRVVGMKSRGVYETPGGTILMEAHKQLEELENAYNEKLTNTSFDSVRDNFKSALLDMESDAEDFANSFEKMMQNAVIESLMTSKYDKLIQDWYTDFAKAMEDGKIDEYEQDFLQKKWNNIVDQGLAERNALKEAMGWESSFSSSQSSTSGGFQTMSQDTGDELNGRFTALQMAGEEIKIQSEFQSQSLNLLTAKADAILSVNTEVRNIADETRTLIANSYLELVQISENTGNTVKYLKDIQTDMAEVKNNTKGLVR